MPKTVLIGLLGTSLDRGNWNSWRPTVSLCQHEELLVDRFELLYPPDYAHLMKQVVRDIRQVSPETKVVPHVLEQRDPWDFEEVYSGLHDFVRGYSFDPEHEDYLVHITTGTHVAQICLFLLTESRHIPGKLIQTSPAKSAAKKEGTYSVIDLDLSRYDRIATRFQLETHDDISFLKSGIETRNLAFNALIERIEQVAIRSRDPILLTGPTGAGKSLLARRIYELKKSRHQCQGVFVDVNCATLRGDAAMSALFGHKKGAFTGAAQDRQGLLRAADGGVLFLDEVGDLGLDEQAMLLRAIEEKRFLPMGSDKECASNFQLICGTHRDLARRAGEGLFRDDLLARINLWAFRMPGLRERSEDIEPNLRYELDRFCGRTGGRVSFNKEALRRFLDFASSSGASWSANFRDLGGAVTRMATLAPGGRITEEVVAEEVERLRAGWRCGDAVADKMQGDAVILEDVLGKIGAQQLDAFDRVQLAEVLRVCRTTSSLSEAGRVLFAVSREKKKTTNDADRVRKYLMRFGVDYETIKRVS